MNKELYLIPANKNKLFESKFITKFINIINPVIKIINYNKKININKEIIKKFEDKPDIIIINFNENNYSNIRLIKNIPRIPIFIDNVFYISPISIKYLNGFSNNKDKQYIINNFIIRILKLYGGIISYNNFIVPKLDFMDFNIGINLYNNNDFCKNYYINKIPKWMTRYIEINNKGWFSKNNRYALEYVFKNYKLSNIVELGTYYGTSALFMAKHKTPDCNLYCIDNYDNILLTNFIVDNPTPIDFKYFFHYFKFESFHARLSDYDNIYSIRNDCYKMIKLFNQYKINVDLFYIDFCKVDDKLINFVDEILDFFPNAIIIGDDAVHLNKSLKYFKEKYQYIFLESCYICSKIPLVNSIKLLEQYDENKRLENINDYEKIKKCTIDYKINYIIKNIEDKNIIEKIIELGIDPNKKSYYVPLNGTLYHYIGMKYWTNQIYYLNLYKKLNYYKKDMNIKNDLNLTPNDYFNYISSSSFS